MPVDTICIIRHLFYTNRHEFSAVMVQRYLNPLKQWFLQNKRADTNCINSLSYPGADERMNRCQGSSPLRGAYGVLDSSWFDCFFHYTVECEPVLILSSVKCIIKMRMENHPHFLLWCGWKDSNLHDVTHTDLNRARLPIPPHPHIFFNACLVYTIW